MMAAEVLATVEDEARGVSATVIALSVDTGASHPDVLVQVIEYHEVRPLRIENYPSLAKVWAEDDDDVFANEPGV